MAKRFPSMASRYSGVPWLDNAELAVNYGKGRTIFVEHLNDLFAAGIPSAMIEEILEHCRRYPENTYVFQTKNPLRYYDYLSQIPEGSVLGTTIESDQHYPEIMGYAPTPVDRFEAMLFLPRKYKLFVTVEPILDFDLEELVDWMVDLRPDFINIGADSKGTGLQEPSGAKVRALLEALKGAGMEVREKHNLERLLKA